MEREKIFENKFLRFIFKLGNYFKNEYDNNNNACNSNII